MSCIVPKERSMSQVVGEREAPVSAAHVLHRARPRVPALFETKAHETKAHETKAHEAKAHPKR